MQANNQNSTSCQDVLFNYKHALVKKICSIVEEKIDNVYTVADEFSPSFDVILTFSNRAFKGKSYFLKDLFKLLFEEDLGFLSRLVRSKTILEDLNINYYLYK